MFALQLKMSLCLVVILTMLNISIRSLYYRGNPVELLLAEQEMCKAICLFGIVPSKTNVRQAKKLLQAHDWVIDIREVASGNGYAQLSWGWSGNQPAVIDASIRGKLTFVWDEDDPSNMRIDDAIVETISIYTLTGIFMFKEFYGTPTTGSINNQLEGMLGYAVYYNKLGQNIGLHIQVQCPAWLAGYWDATTRITVSIGQIKSPYISPVDMIKMC